MSPNTVNPTENVSGTRIDAIAVVPEGTDDHGHRFRRSSAIVRRHEAVHRHGIPELVVFRTLSCDKLVICKPVQGLVSGYRRVSRIDPIQSHLANAKSGHQVHRRGGEFRQRRGFGFIRFGTGVRRIRLVDRPDYEGVLKSILQITNGVHDLAIVIIAEVRDVEVLHAVICAVLVIVDRVIIWVVPNQLYRHVPGLRD